MSGEIIQKRIIEFPPSVGKVECLPSVNKVECLNYNKLSFRVRFIGGEIFQND